MNFLVSYFCKRSFSLTGSLLYKLRMDIIVGIISEYGFMYDDLNQEILLLSWVVSIMPSSAFSYLYFLSQFGFSTTINFVQKSWYFWVFFKCPFHSNLTLVGIFFQQVFFYLLTRILSVQRAFYKNFYDLTRREFYILLLFFS